MAKPGEIPVAGFEGGDVPLLKGLDGVLMSADAAMQSVKEAANDLKVLAERQGQTYGTRVTDGEIAARQRGAYSDILAEVEAIEAEADEIPTNVSKGAVTATAPPPPPIPTNVDDGPPTTTAPNIPNNQEVYEQYRDYLGGKGKPTVRNIRRDVGNRILSKTETPSHQQFFQDDSGQWVDDDGNLATPAALATFLRKEKIAGAVRGFGGGLAQGKTVAQAGLGSAPVTVAKAAGVAGAVLYGGQKIGDFFKGQRAENAKWQAIFGGGQMDAVGERFRSKMFGLSQFGFMDSAEAERLYRAVSETGMQGDERQTALDFSTTMYSRLGMSVQQSMELVKEAASTGQESLAGIAVALEQVSESAVKAGVNAETARQAFIQEWRSVTDISGGGPQSAQLAGAITGAQAGLGREFQNISFGFTDPNQIQRIAVQQGQTYNEVVAQMGADPGAFLAGRVGQMGRDIRHAFTPGGYEAASDLIRRAKADGTYDPNQIAQELLANNYTVHARALKGILQAFGITAPSDFEAVVALVGILSQELDPVGQLEAQRESMQVEEVDVSRMSNIGARIMAGSYADEPVTDAEREAYEAYQEIKGDVYEDRGFLGLGIGLFGADPTSTRVKRAYQQHLRDTDQVGGLVGHIAGDPAAQGAIKTVAIETTSGTRYVSLEDAIRHYGEQLNRGDVEVVEGAAAGQTVAEALGGHGDTSIGTAGPVEDVGVGSAELPEGEAGTTGGVVLGLTPEARRILQPAGLTGPVTYDEEWSPNNPHVTSGQLPTGNP